MIDYSVVLDQNERQRMLDEGYLPEVIDYHARERYEAMVNEFKDKNVILRRYYTDTPFYAFVGDVFPGLDKLMVVTGETTYSEMDIDELMTYHAERNDVYVAPASFIHGCYSGATCKDLYAFVVDIDKIKAETLDAVIENGNLGGMTPMPTYIVNSGSGVHFYYVFQEPVPYYYRNQDALKKMYRALCKITKRNILAKTDWHAITQPFRLPGSQTKLEQVVTGWKCGDKWRIQTLGKRLNVDTSEMDLQIRPLVSQKEYKEELERRAALAESSEPGKPKKKKRKRAWISSLAGKTGFYLSCLQRCYEETQEGSRYRSMMALTVVARKVEYPKEQLEQDLLQLLTHYNQIGRYMNQSEVKKALRMYNDKALQTRSEDLEAWFGWEFRRDAQKRLAKKKEKGTYVKRTRKEICLMARKIQEAYYPDGEWRNKKGAPTAQWKVQQYRAEHPEGKPKDCIEATGLSKNTVYKWWQS
mgnify:CR=1 FL=1